jgi:hypothetical protein
LAISGSIFFQDMTSDPVSSRSVSPQKTATRDSSATRDASTDAPVAPTGLAATSRSDPMLGPDASELRATSPALASRSAPSAGPGFPQQMSGATSVRQRGRGAAPQPPPMSSTPIRPFTDLPSSAFTGKLINS